MNRSIIATGLTFTLLGCSTVGDVVVPPNPNSEAKSPELICLAPLIKQPGAAAFAPAIVGVAAIGFAVDQLAKAIETESKRYKATYSARTTTEFWRATGSGKGKKYGQRVEGFVFERFVGEKTKTASCNPAGRSEGTGGLGKPVMAFEAAFAFSEQKDAMKVIPRQFSFVKAKSKVAEPEWRYPWSWWMFLDEGKGKVDLDVQVAVDAVIDNQLVDVARIDIPIGKVSLYGPTSMKGKQLADKSSGWIPLPKTRAPRGEASDFGPTNVIVTVIEANDLGDVVAKGANELSKSKAKISSGIVNAIGGK